MKGFNTLCIKTLLFSYTAKLLWKETSAFKCKWKISLFYPKRVKGKMFNICLTQSVFFLVGQGTYGHSQKKQRSTITVWYCKAGCRALESNKKIKHNITRAQVHSEGSVIKGRQIHLVHIYNYWRSMANMFQCNYSVNYWAVCLELLFQADAGGWSCVRCVYTAPKIKNTAQAPSYTWVICDTEF